MPFQIQAPYQPAGDQPSAIEQLSEGVLSGEKHQVLLGVTGSGKTFTVANVIQNVQKPTLVLTHNKTLVAQLYGEFKQFFPDNAVEYFVSYYDYYQPEAYLPVTDTYIEKDLNINEELDKLRLRATTSLLSGRRDIIVVASVSCIYGMGNPTDYESGIIRIAKGDRISRQGFLHSLVNSLYTRTSIEFTRGTFRVKGDTVDINLPYVDFGYRITFFGDEIEEIESIEVETSKRIGKLDNAAIFPANLYVAPKDIMQQVIYEIQDEMAAQVEYFKSVGKFIEAQRLKERGLSTRRVMVSEWVDGAGFEEVRQLPQAERDRFGEIVFRFCFGSIFHLQHFNADAHPGNYLLEPDGKVACLDFGMTKHLDKDQIELEITALEAIFDNDPERLRVALHDLGFLNNPQKVDAEQLMEHVKVVGGWYMENREVTVDSRRVMDAIAAVSDPRSEFYRLMRRENLPANELMGRRMESGVLAVLGQLEATRNWYRIGREWWFADPPATPLGEQEWAYFESRGEKRVRPFAARAT
jgi:hypothetical protein